MTISNLEQHKVHDRNEHNLLSVCLAKIIFANLFYCSAYFAIIHGSHCTFWYYSWEKILGTLGAMLPPLT